MAVLLLLLGTAIASAQTDEIQVYDAQIADPGVLNLMIHNNFTPEGLKTPHFPGGLVPNQTLNGVPEWAYGVTLRPGDEATGGDSVRTVGPAIYAGAMFR